MHLVTLLKEKKDSTVTKKGRKGGREEEGRKGRKEGEKKERDYKIEAGQQIRNCPRAVLLLSHLLFTENYAT
jgi:hypothetical protein